MAVNDIEYEENKCKGNIVKAICEECSSETQQTVVSSYDGFCQDVIEEYNINIDHASSFQIIQCRGCKTVSFRMTAWNSDDCPSDQGELVRLYPHRSSLTRALKRFEMLPCVLRKIYEQWKFIRRLCAHCRHYLGIIPKSSTHHQEYRQL